MCWKGWEDGEEETRRRLSFDRRLKTQCEFGSSDGAARSGMSRDSGRFDRANTVNSLLFSDFSVCPRIPCYFTGIDPFALTYRFLCDPASNTPAVKNRVRTKQSWFVPSAFQSFCVPHVNDGWALNGIHLYQEYVLGMFFGELSPTNLLNKTFSSFFTSFLLTFEQTLWIPFNWNVAYNRLYLLSC